MAREERDLAGHNGEVPRAARSADNSTPVTGSWAEHHGSPCSCGCEPVRGERLASILAYTRSQIAESPAKRERRERTARKVDGAA